MRGVVLLGLITLTQLDGNVIWIESKQLAIIKTHCSGKHGAVVSVGGRELCVRETVDVIRERLRDADSHK